MITEEEALQWVALLFELPVDQLSPDTTRASIPLWDSLGVLTLIAQFDDRFGILLAEEDIGRMQTVDDILDVLRREGKLTVPVA